MKIKCLNCETIVEQNFCPQCGQKSTTNRFAFSFKGVWEFVVGAFQFDHKFLFTLKSLFLKPGTIIYEYLNGKRAKYFDWITFLLVIATISHLVESIESKELFDFFSFSNENSEKMTKLVSSFQRENPKIVVLISIPVMALCTRLWFRRVKLNFMEHFVLNTYLSSFLMVIGFVFLVVPVLITNNRNIVQVFFTLYSFISTAYIIWAYHQFFSFYSKKRIWLKSIGVFLTYTVLNLMVGVVIVYLIYHGR